MKTISLKPRLLTIAATIACLAAVSSAAEAFGPPYEADDSPSATFSYPQARRYYGAVDPNPIGYYPYTVYNGSGFPNSTGIGYYPYPDPHPYAAPVPYPFGYYGYSAWGPYGYPGWGPYGYPGWGLGPVYPFGFWF